MHLQAIFGDAMLAPDTRGQLFVGMGHARRIAQWVVQPAAILF